MYKKLINKKEKKMKQTTQSISGTSFWGDTIAATFEELVKAIGEPDYISNDDKVNYEWDMETEDGTVFTIYDWKEYRRIKDDEVIIWHIGGFSAKDTGKALAELKHILSKDSYEVTN